MIGHGCAQVVADAPLILEELLADDGADRVAPEVGRPGAAAAVAVEAGERIGAANRERAAEHVALHKPGVSPVPRRCYRWGRSGRSRISSATLQDRDQHVDEVKTLAIILKPIFGGWAVCLTDGRELVRFRGPGPWPSPSLVERETRLIRFVSPSVRSRRYRPSASNGATDYRVVARSGSHGRRYAR